MLFGFFVIPLIIGSVLLFLYYKDLNKKKELLSETGFGDVQLTQTKLEDLQAEIEKLSKEKERLTKDLDGIHDFKTALNQKNIIEDKIKSLNSDIEKKNELIRTLEQKVKELDQSIIKLEDEELLQSFGIYTPKYDLTNSQQYKEKLKDIRDKQKEMVRKRKATNHFDNWQLDGSAQKGKVFNNNNIKLTIRAFNNECDAIVSSVTFNNITSMERRIKKAYDTLNKVNKHSKIEIKPEYLSLKLDELYLAYEYKQKLEEEKEEQRRIKEQIREEQKVLQEMKKAREKVEKEEKHFSQALDDLYSKIMASRDDNERNILEEKIKELERQLEDVKKIKADIENREQNTRAGYVYVISFEMKNENNATEYFLYYGTNHIKGLEKMKDAMWSVDNSGAYTFSDYEANQTQLRFVEFDAPDLNILADEIYSKFKNQKVQCSTVKEFVVTDTIFRKSKHATEALNILENERKVMTVHNRKRHGYPEYVTLEFN